MTALYIIAATICLVSFIFILTRPTARSFSLAALLLGLAGQTLLFAAPGDTLNQWFDTPVAAPLGDLLFVFSLLMLFWWLRPALRLRALGAFLVSTVAAGLVVFFDTTPFSVADPLAFGQTLDGSFYSMIYSAWIIAGGIVLVSLRPVHSVRVSRAAITLLRTAGVLCLVYAALRVALPLMPESYTWRATTLRTIATSGISLFAFAVIFSSTASALYNWRVQASIDRLVDRRFGGRNFLGREEQLFLRGPLGRTADTIVNAAAHYPESFPTIGGNDGVPLRRLLMYLRVFDEPPRMHVKR